MSKRTIKQSAQNRRRGRQNQLFVIIGVVIVSLGIVAILVALGNKPASPSGFDPALYAGMSQQIDRTGAPALSLGSNSATATLVEYSDFSCPHCRDMADTIHQLIAKYVRDGRLRILYKPVTFINPTYSPSAARAVLCAADQGKGWEMHDMIWQLFDSNHKDAGAYSLDSLSTLATALPIDTARFQQCYNSVETTTALTGLENERLRLGVDHTPTIMLNGQIVDGDIVTAVASAVGN